MRINQFMERTIALAILSIISLPSVALSVSSGSEEEDVSFTPSITRPIDEFKGETLVIGSTEQNHPDKYTIDIEGGDLKGSGWNARLLRSLPKNRFETILFENVGRTLTEVRPGDQQSTSTPTDYYDLLQQGGRLIFKSFRDGNMDQGLILGLIRENPIGIDDESNQIIFLNEEIVGSLRHMYRDTGQLNDIMGIVRGRQTFKHPATQICLELFEAGFKNIRVTTNDSNNMIGILLPPDIIRKFPERW